MSTLSGVTVYIYRDSYWKGKPIYGELQVLEDTKTTLHYVGSASRRRSIDFWLLQESDFNTIQIDYKAGNDATLLDWRGDSYTVKIMDLSITNALWDTNRSGSKYTVLQCRAEVLEQ